MSVEHRTEADEEVVRGAAGMPEPPAAPAAGTAADLDDLEEAMRDVVDPELGINVVDLGLVYGITVDANAAPLVRDDATGAVRYRTDITDAGDH